MLFLLVLLRHEAQIVESHHEVICGKGGEQNAPERPGGLADGKVRKHQQHSAQHKVKKGSGRSFHITSTPEQAE